MKRTNTALFIFSIVLVLFAAYQTVDISLLKCETRRLSSVILEEQTQAKEKNAQIECKKPPDSQTIITRISESSKSEFVPLDINLSTELQEHTWSVCQKYNVPFAVVTAIAWHESRFNLNALGYNIDGTYDNGLMQINDINRSWLAEDHGLDVYDPYDNIEAGIIILSEFWHKYTPEQALTAYAWGEAGMIAQGKIASSAYRILEKSQEYNNGDIG